ncbi:rod shape-determining protein MreC [Aquabacterium sp. J223]|uniref:rod shape-determining protein MreC n=1 Tax=Aquabacterium sp. J223 TaxID=2898431 RepID=UPI0021AE1F43|nr:rod shape-determining protein MreC [Aquabacterium sp. J223]UUX96271.1 rod shape-determining protein MreC [Aquabacterium sp. J223]
MPFGTLDRNPPPFFRQGHSALTKLVVCSALALFLMVADTRLKLMGPSRSVLATALLPLQRAMQVPLEIWRGGGDYLLGLAQARAKEDEALRRLAAQSERIARVAQLETENDRLRALLDLKPKVQVRSLAAEVLYEARDPFSRKVIIDRGQVHGVVAGAPVVNEAGVLGQVVRLYPFGAEVALLNDKDFAIPVLNTRTQARSAAYGATSATGMELRFMATNADVQAGDLLTTSGVDGIYPPGIPVAKVVSVDRQSDSGFARIALAPLATTDAVRHVLVLEPLALQLPERPDVADAPAEAPAKKPPAKPATGGRR